MGFLSSFIRQQTRRAVSSAISDGLSDLLGGSSDSSEVQSSGTTSYNSSVSAAPSKAAQRKEKADGEKGLRNRLEQVLNEEWSGYEVRRQVPTADFSAPARARSYSYGIYSGGQPKAMLMVIRNRSDYRKREVKDAQEACKQNGIPYMNFFSHLPNRSDYISQRLKTNILV